MGKWKEKAGRATPLVSSPGTAGIESITEGLSTRARHVLRYLRVKDVAALLKLTRAELLQTRTCGKKTVIEIELLQSRLAPPNERKSILSINPLSYENAPSEVFDAVKGSLSVRSTHVLNDLGIDSLKAFMILDRVRLFTRRNCGRKTADEILRIQAGITGFARKLVNRSGDFRPEQLLAAPCIGGATIGQTNTAGAEDAFAEFENPAPWLAEWIRSLARSKKQAHAFMLRKGMLGLAPMTLDLVGEKVGGVSRERARQMERAVEERAGATHEQRKLRPLIGAFAAVVRQRGGMVALNELIKAVLCRGKDGDHLTSAAGLVEFFSTLQVWKDSGLLLQKDGVVRDGTSRPVVRGLAAVVDEVASSAADERHTSDLWSIDREQLRDGLKKSFALVSATPTLEHVPDALLDAVLKQCKERVKPYRGRVYSMDLWRLRFGNVAEMVDTVLHQVGKPAHFSKIAEYASKWRPGISERNVHAALDRSDNALLWDLGTFVHKDNVVLPFSLIHDVERWLLEMLKEDLPFVSVNGAFLQFHTRCEQAAFPSEVALYTCLRQSSHPELVYPRLPCVYLKKRFTERIPMVLAFEEFLRDAGGPVSQQELREFGIGKLFLRDYQFYQVSQRLSNVIRTADWGYVYLDNSGLDRKSILPLIRHTQEVLIKEEHCSVDKIYRDKRVTCKSAGIDGPVMLYSVLQYFGGELFSLDGYPRVARCHYGEERKRQHSIRHRVLDFVRDSRKPCPYEVLEKRFVEELGYKEQQVYSVVLDDEVCLYHPGCVIHHQTLAWDDAKQHLLEHAALHIYEDAVRGNMYFGRVSHLVESGDLPPLPPDLNWSATMIADLLTKGGRYLVLGNSREAFVPRMNDQGLQSFEDLIAKLLNRDWGGAANLAAFEGALAEAGLIKKRLSPVMLGSGEIVVIKNGEILLKELLVDAQRP